MSHHSAITFFASSDAEGLLTPLPTISAPLANVDPFWGAGHMDDMNGTNWTVFTSDADPFYDVIGVFCLE